MLESFVIKKGVRRGGSAKKYASKRGGVRRI